MVSRLTLTLRDRATPLHVTLPGPDPARLHPRDAVRLGQVVARWCDRRTQLAAWDELDGLRAAGPEATLYGLSWLIATWARVHQAATETPAEQVIDHLDGDRARRFDRSSLEHELWEWLTHVVRLGALAALVADPAHLATFEAMATDPPGFDRLVLQHQLVLLDGLARDLAPLLPPAPWGLIDALAGLRDESA